MNRYIALYSETVPVSINFALENENEGEFETCQ